MEPVTSLQNPRVKLANGLQKRARTRRKEQKIVLEGVRLIRDVIERGHMPEFIFYEPRTMDYELLSELQEKRIDLIPVTEEVLLHISDTQQPQGVVGVFPLPRPKLPVDPKRVLILDAIREPGNMGTILRAAAAADVWVVLLAPGCVDPYNPKVLRAGMGAHFRVPIVEAEWYQIKEYCANTQVLLATGHGDTAYTDIDWNQKWSVIIGNEAEGGGKAAAEMAQTGIYIPMAGGTESLNAAVATGVILFEAQRQRLDASS